MYRHTQVDITLKFRKATHFYSISYYQQWPRQMANFATVRYLPVGSFQPERAQHETFFSFYLNQSTNGISVYSSTISAVSLYTAIVQDVT